MGNIIENVQNNRATDDCFDSIFYTLSNVTDINYELDQEQEEFRINALNKRWSEIENKLNKFLCKKEYCVINEDDEEDIIYAEIWIFQLFSNYESYFINETINWNNGKYTNSNLLHWSRTQFINNIQEYKNNNNLDLNVEKYGDYYKITPKVIIEHME